MILTVLVTKMADDIKSYNETRCTWDFEREGSDIHLQGNLVVSVWEIWRMSTNSDHTTLTAVQRKDRDDTSNTVFSLGNIIVYIGELNTLYTFIATMYHVK